MPISAMLGCVALVRTYVSEERVTSITRVKRINELKAMLAAISNCIYNRYRDLLADYVQTLYTSIRLLHMVFIKIT
jgi:hypothetical protein